MECQYAGCYNTGIDGCNGCGRIICGMHIGSRPGPWIYCRECTQSRQQAADKEARVQQQVHEEQIRERKKQEEAATRSGCRIAWLGLGIIVGTIVLSVLLLATAGNQNIGWLGGVDTLFLLIGAVIIIMGINGMSDS